MELRVRNFGVRTGAPRVVVIHRTDAHQLDLYPSDRAIIQYGPLHTVAVLDVLDHRTDPRRAVILKHGEIGLFEEVTEALGVHDGATVTILPEKKPESLALIKKKLEGGRLSEPEIRSIIKDIVDGALTDIELTYFVSAVSMRNLTFREMTALTKAVALTGDRFEARRKPVIDKHCIGGVPNNRTTMILVPILAANGLVVPKTSSRAITSPAGTADTMECLADVGLPLHRMQEVVEKTGACITWGGAINLAPADDNIIRIERPMSIDVAGLMISSVMAKKYSVGATHVIIDIPWGHGAKVETLAEAKKLRRLFLTIGRLLGMKMIVVLTDGSQPIGRGIGPLLEALDVLKILKNEKDAPADLREKSLMLAGTMLEFVGKAKKKEGIERARRTLSSGAAYRKMLEIIEAQGAKQLPPLAKVRKVFFAPQHGKIVSIDNNGIAKIARYAGAPVSQSAGLLLHAHVGDRVVKGEPLFTVYCESDHKLAAIENLLAREFPFTIKK